jgi:hypothetical protein
MIVHLRKTQHCPEKWGGGRQNSMMYMKVDAFSRAKDEIFIWAVEWGVRERISERGCKWEVTVSARD